MINNLQGLNSTFPTSKVENSSNLLACCISDTVTSSLTKKN